MAEDKFPDIQIPRASGALVRGAIIGIIALIGIFTTFYTVEPEEVALVLRFGQYVRTAEPGLNFKVPFGLEQALKVPIQRQLKEEFGFRTVSAGVQSRFTTSGLGDEANMLTGDLNAAVVEWVVQYRIVDPYLFLFKVRNVRETLRDLSEAVMRRIVGDRTVNEVLTVGRAEVANEVLIQLQALCDQFETGINIDQVVLQDVNPPESVKGSFNEVNEAQQERERLINQAQSEYNKVIPRATGEAQQTIQLAEGYALERVNEARGDSARFVALFEEYRRAPDVTRTRIYLETMNVILPQVQSKVIVDEDLQSFLPLLNLSTGTAEGGR